jgi:hypothetical protein
MVAYPIYLLITWAVVRDGAAHPEKLDSSIRKWLTYMALVVAAAVFMGDLIGALAYLLRGELTSRFIAKSLVVLTLSGGVFFYYYGGLRKSDGEPGRLSRDRLMAVVCSILVIAMVVLGFSQSGPPKAQRELRADSQRVQQLYQLSNRIRNYWSLHSSQLPTGMEQLSGPTIIDPIMHTPYEYHPKQGSEYQLCATFAHGSEGPDRPTGPNEWVHPAGHHCFSLDASAPAQFPMESYGNYGN